ncbi:CHAD domain-containing protein [Streptomyces sp. NPDC127066]|uniref:CHAD domain-containing protein n=1 Tax=Streptomyces sp. NPDC127066 TaxID=3347125 RepID=UPI0036566274
MSAEALLDGEGHANRTEMEVELAEDGDPALLDGVEKVLRRYGLDRAQSPSKVVHALTETTLLLEDVPGTRAGAVPGSAGEYVLAYLDRLVGALTDLDPAVRRDLKWLANELGVERDHEVLRERLTSGVRELSGELVLGPVEARLKAWDVEQRTEARRRTLDMLASPRYPNLLEHLKSLTETPPLHAAKAAGHPGKVLGKALRKEYRRLAGRMEPALDMAPGPGEHLLRGGGAGGAQDRAEVHPELWGGAAPQFENPRKRAPGFHLQAT